MEVLTRAYKTDLFGWVHIDFDSTWIWIRCNLLIEDYADVLRAHRGELDYERPGWRWHRNEAKTALDLFDVPWSWAAEFLIK